MFIKWSTDASQNFNYLRFRLTSDSHIIHIIVPRPVYITGNMLCRCGNQVNHLQTKKGANAGRWYYTCRANKCGFFAWDYNKKGAKSQQNGYSSKSKTVGINSKCDDNNKSDSNQNRNGNQSSKTNTSFGIYDKSRFIVRGYHES